MGHRSPNASYGAEVHLLPDTDLSQRPRPQQIRCELLAPRDVLGFSLDTPGHLRLGLASLGTGLEAGQRAACIEEGREVCHEATDEAKHRASQSQQTAGPLQL